ncbi:MAG: DNA-binding response regulator [Nitrospinaceae bacterium]|nr:MAG: DNA-binding response regulator [Nitrospinaceae bacterium]
MIALDAINIFIADDHAIVREGLKKILSCCPEMAITGEANNGHVLLQKIMNNGWDVLILDIAMPGPNIIDILKEIKSKQPDLPVLIYTMYPENQYAVRLLKAGASGYLTKNGSIPDLLEAIRKVAEGRKYVSHSLAEKLAEDLEVSFDTPSHNLLSNREYQVFTLIASGRTVSEIAAELSLSVPTISTYRSRILEKLKLSNNSQLTYYAIKNGLIH